MYEITIHNTITVFFKCKHFFITIKNIAYLIIVFIFNIYNIVIMTILSKSINYYLNKNKNVIRQCTIHK